MAGGETAYVNRRDITPCPGDTPIAAEPGSRAPARIAPGTGLGPSRPMATLRRHLVIGIDTFQARKMSRFFTVRVPSRL